MKQNLQLILFAFLISGIDIGAPSYLIYSILLILILFTGRGLKFKELPPSCYPIVFLILWSLSGIGSINKYFLSDVGLMFLGVLWFCFQPSVSFNIKKLNILCIIGLLVALFPNLSNIHISVESVLNSDIGTEASMLSFVLPLFAIFFYRNKEYKFCLLNIVCSVIAGKRIAVLGCILVILIIAIEHFFNKDKFIRIIKLAAFLLPFIYIQFTLLLTSGLFDDVILEYTGLSANHFTMGRQTLYEFVFEKLGGNTLFGSGTGTVVQILDGYGIDRLHNDFLKIYIENGIIGFSIFLFLLAKNVNRNTYPYLLYTMVLFLTDNTLLYIAYMVPFYMFEQYDKFFLYDKTKYVEYSGDLCNPSSLQC